MVTWLLKLKKNFLKFLEQSEHASEHSSQPSEHSFNHSSNASNTDSNLSVQYPIIEMDTDRDSTRTSLNSDNDMCSNDKEFTAQVTPSLHHDYVSPHNPLNTPITRRFFYQSDDVLSDPESPIGSDCTIFSH